MSNNQESDSTEQKPVIADKMPSVMKLEAGDTGGVPAEIF